MIIAFVHHTAVNEETGEVEQDDIPKIVVEKKWVIVPKPTLLTTSSAFAIRSSKVCILFYQLERRNIHGKNCATEANTFYLRINVVE